MISTSRAFVPRIATAERQPSEVKMSGRDFMLHVCYVWVRMGMGMRFDPRSTRGRSSGARTCNFSNPAGRVSPLG
jgi:hypothetical protein